MNTETNDLLSKLKWTSNVVLEVEYEEYERYGSAPKRKRKLKGSLINTLKKIRSEFENIESKDKTDEEISLLIQKEFEVENEEDTITPQNVFTNGMFDGDGDDYYFFIKITLVDSNESVVVMNESEDDDEEEC